MKGIFIRELEEIEQHILKGKYEIATEKIDAIVVKENVSNQEKIKCKILRAQIQLETSLYSRTIKYCEEAYEDSKTIENKELMFDSLVLLPEAYFRAGEYELREERIKLASQILNSFENKNSEEYLKRKAKTLLMKEDIYSRTVVNIEESIAIAKKLGLDHQLVDAYNELCKSYLWSGELNKIEITARRSMELAETLEYPQGLGLALMGLMVAHLHKGELNKSQDYAFKCNSVFEELGDSFGVARTYIDMGYLCWLKRDLKGSLNYFQKSMNLFKKAKIVGTRHYPWALLRMNLVLIEVDRYDEAYKNLEQIELLYILKDIPLFKKIYYLAKIILLKTQKEDNWKEIISLLEEVADDPIVHLELNGWIAFHLCDAYLREFQKSGDLDTYGRFKERVQNLVQMAEQQNSYILLTQSLILQSKLELIDLNIYKGQSLLEKAQFLAEDKGISNLARLISNEIDLLLDQLSKWEEMSTYLPSLEERLGFTHIEDLLMKLVKNNLAYLEVLDEKESPLIFLILNKEGTVQFSEQLGEATLNEKSINDIMKFIQVSIAENTFDKKTIRRLKHKKYSMAIYNQDEVLFIYVFIGRSYYAVKKLNELIMEVQSFSQIWSKVSKKLQKNENLDLEDRLKFARYLDDLFSS